MLAAEVATTEAAVTDDALRGIPAVLEITSDLLGCTASDRKHYMYCALSVDIVVRQRFFQRRQMLAGEDKSELGFW